MLDFFSDPYEDELLYSALARYHYFSGNISMRETLVQAFGDGNTLPSVVVPCRLQHLSNQLQNDIYTADYLVWKHTILPYYLPFMNRNRQERVLSVVKGDGGKSLFTLIGMAAGGICRKPRLHYCSECARNDVERYGEAYFHRNHQLEGVWVCDRHGLNLREYPVAKDNVSRIQFIRFDSKHVLLDKRDHDLETTESKLISTKLWDISKAARSIIEGIYLGIDNSKVYENITSWLANHNYITKKGRVRQKDFCHDMKAFYGDRLLDSLECNFVLGTDYSWPCEATRRSSKAIHPVRYILISLFLAGNANGLFNPPEYKIKQDRINATDNRNSFDEEWKTRLTETIKSGDSLRGTAREMGCDPKTVVKYARMLGIENPLNSSMKLYMPKDKGGVTDYSTDTDNICQYVQEHPNCTRSEIRKALSCQYMRLYRNQRELLYSILPERVKLPGGVPKVDWNARDTEILEKARKAYLRLLFMIKPVHISFSRLMKDTGYPSLRFYIDKLPATKSFFEKATESIEQFQLRRVDYVCHKLYDNSGTLKKWEVMRIAGLKEPVSKKILARIEKNIEKLCDMRLGEEYAQNCFQNLAISQFNQGHDFESWESGMQW